MTLVEAPAARVADVPPLDAKATDETCAGGDGVRTAVRVCALTFLTVKTLVNVRADGTRPNARARVSTSPVAIGVDVPTCTALPGATW